MIKGNYKRAELVIPRIPKEQFLKMTEMEKEEMEKEEIEKEWEKFRKSGLLWFVNMILHTFGYAIVIEYQDNKIKYVYPKRCKYRGFTESANAEGYKKVSEYLEDNISELVKECYD